MKSTPTFRAVMSSNQRLYFTCHVSMGGGLRRLLNLFRSSVPPPSISSKPVSFKSPAAVQSVNSSISVNHSFIRSRRLRTTYHVPAPLLHLNRRTGTIAYATVECRTPHCKNILSTDILWRVFHILTEPVPYRPRPTFVAVNRRNNEAGPHLQ